MLNRIVFFSLALFTFSGLFSQSSVLSKKEVETRLEEIQNQIDGKEFEMAMQLLKSKTEIILEENVPKKSQELYEQIKTVLNGKEELFIKNQLIVEDFEKKYDAHDYCESIGVLDLDLNNENSFLSTRDFIFSNKSKYESAKTNCEDNKKEIREWQDEYNAKNYEKLFSAAEISRSQQDYVFKDDLQEYTALMQNLHMKQNSYNRVKSEFVDNPSQLIQNLNYDKLTYDQAKKAIDDLTNVLENENELYSLEGNNPELNRKYKSLKPTIQNSLNKLKDYRDALAPMTPGAIFSGANSKEPITFPFIRNKCEKIESLGGTSIEDNKLFYLYDQDVFYYYYSELSYLTTQDQKEAYKRSTDYREKEAELSKLKNRFSETVFYVEIPQAFRYNPYDRATKSFKIQVSTDTGNDLGDAKPPKCVQRIDISNLIFSTEQNSSGAKEDKLLLNTDPAIAKAIEENSRDISLFFLFKIKHGTVKQYKFSTYRGESKNIIDPVFTPSFVRVVAVNTITGEFYYDELFQLQSNEQPVAWTNNNTGMYRGVVNETPSAESVTVGDYYALIIGIDEYSGIWPSLGNAVNDAQAVEQMLKEYYHFDYFKTLYNSVATRQNIIQGMEWLVKNVKENDNVLIFYSGHGDFNKALNKGSWVPADATSSSISEYISNSVIQDFLKGINSKHTLLLADACFSGDIFRGSKIESHESSEKYFSKIYSLKSRQAISSGGVEPVMDGGGEGHSVFSYYLLKALKDNQSHYMDAEQLYSAIKVPVVNNSEQSPLFSPVKNTGDEGGQFIFIRK